MKKKTKLFSLVMAVTLCANLLSGCLTNQATTDTPANNSSKTDIKLADGEKQTIIRFSSNIKQLELVKPGPGLAIATFAEKIEERTNGKYKIQIFVDGQLGKSAEEVLGGAQNGAFEMFNFALGSWGEYTDAFMPMNIPYLYPDNKTVYSIVDGEIGNKMRDKALEDTDLMVLSFLDIGFRHITNSKREVKSPDDLKGLKIRTMTDPYQIAAMEAMGASCTPINYSELFTSLQQKLVDGQENPLGNIVSSKFQEVQQYLTLTNHTYTFTSIGMSKAAFDKLPADIQKIFLEEARNAELLAREGVASQDESDLAILKSTMQVYEPNSEELEKFRVTAQKSWGKIEEAMGSDYFNQVISEVEKLIGTK